MAVGNEIFKVKSVEHADNIIKAVLSVNADSPIFKGHFPGQPVIPGASMLQAVKDVLIDTLGYKIQLKKGDNLKFVGMMEPGATNTAFLEISYTSGDDGIAVTAKLSEGDRVCFKFQGAFVHS